MTEHASHHEHQISEIKTFLRSIFADPDTSWRERLSQLTNKEKANLLKERLVNAIHKITYCVDERVIGRILRWVNGQPQIDTHVENYQRGAALPGGALFWLTLFRSFGDDLENAIQKTKQLYNQMGWGDMEIHIDDHHGDLNALIRGQGDKVLGCGFLGVSADVVNVITDLFPDLNLQPPDNTPLHDIVHAMFQAGATVVELTGAHKAEEAAYVINTIQGQTLNPPELYNDNPAFITDLWVAGMKNNEGKPLHQILFELTGKDIDKETLERLIAATSLATAQLLGVPKENIVYLQS